MFPPHSFRCRLQLRCRHLRRHCITGLQTTSFNSNLEILNTFRLLATTFWLLATTFRLLATTFWLLATTFRLLATTFRLLATTLLFCYPLFY